SGDALARTGQRSKFRPGLHLGSPEGTRIRGGRTGSKKRGVEALRWGGRIRAAAPPRLVARRAVCGADLGRRPGGVHHRETERTTDHVVVLGETELLDAFSDLFDELLLRHRHTLTQVDEHVRDRPVAGALPVSRIR